ncbi:mCG147002 [Mus musculus]|nr:mCG147002 [Mus musculus]
MSGTQIYFLAEDKAPEQGLSQKLCCFCSLQALLRRLVSEGLGIQDGSLTCSGG